jgi:hypothetical protein
MYIQYGKQAITHQISHLKRDNNTKQQKLSLSQVPTPLALLGLMVNVERVSAILSLRA